MNHPHSAQSAGAIARLDRAFLRNAMIAMTLFIALSLAWLLAAAPAHAQASAPIDGKVVVPWGDWIATAFLGLGAGAIAWINRHVPEQWRTNVLLQAAIQWAINATPGAVKGKSLTLEIGSQVLERVIEYLVALAPAWLERRGGVEAVRKMALARMDFEADVDVRVLDTPPRGFAARAA